MELNKRIRSDKIGTIVLMAMGLILVPVIIYLYLQDPFSKKVKFPIIMIGAWFLASLAFFQKPVIKLIVLNAINIIILLYYFFG